jgi:hypothetical protein
MAASARTAFGVRVVDPTAGDTGIAVLLGGFFTAVFGDVFGMRGTVTVQIVVAETGEPLVEWKSQPADAGLLRSKIESDLGQLDAESFASEWGLPSPNSADDDST